MGIYVNPKDGSAKEDWLARNGQSIPESEVIHSIMKNFDFSGDRLPVCLVDNGWMTAAGIAYDRREAEAFLHPDARPKQWYLVPRDLLKQFDDSRSPVI
jgi:hypothetical protein